MAAGDLTLGKGLAEAGAGSRGLPRPSPQFLQRALPTHAWPPASILQGLSGAEGALGGGRAGWWWPGWSRCLRLAGAPDLLANHNGDDGCSTVTLRGAGAFVPPTQGAQQKVDHNECQRRTGTSPPRWFSADVRGCNRA